MRRLLAFAFLPFLAHAECKLAKVAELPITASADDLMITVRINEEPARFVFDTGSATTVINAASIQRLNLRSVRPDHGTGALTHIEGLGGAVSARAVEARSIDLGGLRARDFAFVAANLPVFNDWRDPPDGLLSSDLLAKYDIDFDLTGGRIRLYYPLNDCAHPAAFMHGPLYAAAMLPGSDQRSPRLNVDVAGITLAAVIDTGASQTIVLAPAARRFRPVSATMAMMKGIAGRPIQGIKTILPVISVGDLEFDHFPVVLSTETVGETDHPVDMILGRDFLRIVHVWLSFSSHTVIMQFPPA